MPSHLNRTHVTFVLDHSTVTTTVTAPEGTSPYAIIEEASRTLAHTYHFDPSRHLEGITLTNEAGEVTHTLGTHVEKSDPPNTSKVLPAGTYYVGDPCYAFDVRNDPHRDLWLDLLDSAGGPAILEAHVPGHTFVASITHHGDGTYHDQFGNAYIVDAGLIGVVPVGQEQNGSTIAAMVKHTFDTPFTVSYDNGTITLGPLTIDTGDSAFDGYWYGEDDEAGN